MCMMVSLTWDGLNCNPTAKSLLFYDVDVPQLHIHVTLTRSYMARCPPSLLSAIYRDY